MKVSAVSENACLIQVGDEISESLTTVIANLSSSIESKLSDVLIDLVPSYTTLLCVYDPHKMDYLRVLHALRQIVSELSVDDGSSYLDDSSQGKLIEVPVWYDPEVGYDLERMAAAKQISIEAILETHTAKDYKVFAMGFMPGFAFMGRVEPLLATPRQQTPRKAVAAGSVGIADIQTAVYPAQSPGGWNIIGRSPSRFFDVQKGDKAALLSVGDRVRFVAIDRATFIELGGKI